MKTCWSVALLILIVFVFAAAASLRFQGTVFEGVGETTLRSGGATLIIQLNGQYFKPLTSVETLRLLRETRATDDTKQNAWNANLDSLFGPTAKLYLSNHRRIMKVTFGAVPNVNVTEVESIQVKLPAALIEGATADIIGPAFYLLPESRISVVMKENPAIATRPTNIELSGDITSLSFGYKVKQGTGCKGSNAVLASAPLLDPVNKVISLTPMMGGALSVCYYPTQDAAAKAAKLYVQAKGDLFVAGPEGFTCDPMRPRAESEFTATFFGTSLTEQDLVAFSEKPCDSIPSVTELFEVTLSSSSRAVVLGEIHHQGNFNVCYNRFGASHFTKVGTLDIKEGGEEVISHDAGDITVRTDTVVEANVHIRKLTVEAGNLGIDHYSVNVSEFHWNKGTITSRNTGVIHLMGSMNIIRATSPIILETILKNFGTLEIDLSYLTFSQHGAIHNYGHLIIHVNSNDVDSAALHSISDRSVILNYRGGHLTFICATGPSTVEASVLVENKGLITVPTNCTVMLRKTRGYTEGLYRVTGGQLVMYSGEAKSVFEVDGQLKFLHGPFNLRTVVIHGVDAQVTFQDGNFNLDGIHVSGKVNLLFRGNPTTLTLKGHNHFDSNVIVAMKDTHILGREAMTSYFSVAGKLLCHISSVSFGDNIVLTAKLQTVLFGVGVEGSTAELVPQNVPQNSSLMIPPNATLVIMDIGNFTQSELLQQSVTPKVCAHYVVVPMNVRSHGRILLRGCALLPFGGVHHGMVYGDAQQIETTVRYALCRNVLAFPDVCIPLFSHDYMPSGLAYGGQHEFHPLALPAPSVDVDYVELLRHASLDSLDHLRMFARQGILINSDARMSLTNGATLSGAMITINGLLSSAAEHPLQIQGNVLVAPNGTLKMRVSTDSCTFPLSISDTLTFIQNSRLQCDSSLNSTAGSSAAMLTAAHISGVPLIDKSSCSGNEHVIAIQRPDSIGIQLRNAKEYPSSKTKVICLLFVFGLVAVVIALLTFNQSCWMIGGELRKKTEFPLYLSWPEFSSYVYNLISGCSIFADAMMLSLTAFHAFVPLPNTVNGLQRLGNYLMTPHSAPHHSTSVLVGFLCTLLCIWILAWIPLAGKTFSDHLKRLLHNREQPTQRHLIQFLFQFHTFASWFALFGFIPVVSYLMDSVACFTFLSDSVNCSASLKQMAIPAFPLMCIFLFLAPYSSSCRSFPFGHPPYMRELDLRYKSMFIYFQYALYFVQVGLWKIYSTNTLQLLIGSLLILGAHMMLTALSSPCAYRNINVLKTYVCLYPIWAVLCSLIQVARYGPYQQYVCQSSDPIYVFFLFSGWGIITVILVSMLRKRGGKTADDFMLQVDPSTVVHLRALQEHHERIEECRLEMYNTASVRERERVADNISTLRIQYLQLLNLYRRKKERFLLPYYLGELIGGSVVSSQLEDLDFEENHTPSFLRNQMASQFDKPVHLQDVEMEENLDAEQMEGWIRGPLLGRGSYGVVSMGMLPNGKLVAVKEIEISKKYKKETLSSVKKEVNMLRTLNHANIIRYYGCHATGRQMKVFMEFAVGGSLTSLVRKFDCLTEPVARGYTYQILCGLNYLHSKHVVHRDIKGENILIDGHGTAKLADFGCSKGLADIANKSREGCASLVGSPFWMAPEVIKNEAYGTKADIWSVGCTVVEVLNGGNPPWSEKFDNIYTAMYFIGNTTELPSNIPTDVSANCKDFLAKCFLRDISQRPSAAELLKHPWIVESFKSSEGSPDNLGGNGRQWSDMFDSDATDTERGTTLQSDSQSAYSTTHEERSESATVERSESSPEHDDQQAK